MIEHLDVLSYISLEYLLSIAFRNSGSIGWIKLFKYKLLFDVITILCAYTWYIFTHMFTKLIFILETISDFTKLWTHQLFYIADPQTHMLFRKQFIKCRFWSKDDFLHILSSRKSNLWRTSEFCPEQRFFVFYQKLIICICAFNLQELVDALVIVWLSL